mmetsp:Transcript_6720/g.9761  ORF Transcript_6720/g.9761 Transcript_6720/m.9761 type:complete len:345 (+) Transcript_6720:269-1303(+)
MKKEPIDIKKIEQEIKEEIIEYKYIQNGHNLILTKNGNIYSWGMNAAGQCGLEHQNITVEKPTKINIQLEYEDEKVTHIYIGKAHSVAQTNKHNLYGWGWNEDGQCGVGSFMEYITRPKRIKIRREEDDIKIKQISVGGYHNLMLTEKGTLYTWGENLYGECGTGTNVNLLEPNKIKDFLRGKETITRVEALDNCNLSIAVTSRNKYYIWGEFANLNFKNPKPERIERPLHFISLAGLVNIAKHLIVKQKLNINEIKHGWTPLGLAVLAQNKNMVKLLIEQKANINIPLKYERTALTDAIYLKKYDIVKLLLQQDPKQIHKQHQSCSLLHLTLKPPYNYSTFHN